MENNVRGIRDIFYNDLIYEYQTEQDSFLYRYFLAESVKELQNKLEKNRKAELLRKSEKNRKAELQDKPENDRDEKPLSKPENGRDEKPLSKPENDRNEKPPGTPENAAPKQEPAWPKIGSQIWPEDISPIRDRLRDIMEEHKDWARGLLLREPPGKKDKRERRDFWEELWLNDAGYLAGLITDREYYLWLVEYLEARDIYYKDIGIGENLTDAHTWLYTLLYEGLRGTGDALAREELVRQEFGTTVNIRTKSQVESDLKKLAELMRRQQNEHDQNTPEKESAFDRLHHLKKKAANGKDTYYLLWLTRRLERMAIHIKIKTWLQDSGYPLKITGMEEKAAKEPRKQDFSMRIFEAYFDDHYEFIRKKQGGRAALEEWHRDGEFCMVGSALAKALLSAVQESGNDVLYIPLAVHLFTGCVFFLAGKENYRELYEKEPDKKQKEAYEKAEGCCCFDYLRLDEDCLAACPGDILGALKMQPSYHKNAGNDYDTALSDFKRYCLSLETSPLQAVKTWNDEMPEAIPDAFRWAFDSPEITERPKSPESVAKFIETWKKAGKAHLF